MSAIDSLSFHADGNSIRARFVTPGYSRPADFQSCTNSAKATEVCGLTLRRKTNRQACFISPSAERPIVRRFETRGKIRAGFRVHEVARPVLGRIGATHGLRQLLCLLLQRS